MAVILKKLIQKVLKPEGRKDTSTVGKPSEEVRVEVESDEGNWFRVQIPQMQSYRKRKGEDERRLKQVQTKNTT